MLGEAGGDAREPLVQPGALQMGGVEVHVIRAFAAHLRHHGPHRDVARGQLGARIGGEHESLSLAVAQVGPSPRSASVMS